MPNFYQRIGIRTFKNEEIKKVTQKEKIQYEEEAKRSAEKRHENMRKSLGFEEPSGMTVDVTPAGVKARQEAIAAEQAKIDAEEAAAETQKTEKSEEVIAATKTKKKGAKKTSALE